MNELFDFTLEKLVATFLVFARISGIFLIAPLFKSLVIRPVHKVLLAMYLAYILTMSMNLGVSLDFHPFVIFLVVMKEILLGFLIGFSVNLVFWAANFAGGLIDFEVGFYAARLLSFSESTPSIFGEILELLTLMLFFAINGHYYIFEALHLSLQKVPLGALELKYLTFEQMGKFLGIVTILALKISAPIIVATFLINVSLALLARMAPQTNIFVVSFQVKIFVALVIFFLSVPFFGYACKFFLQEFQTASLNLLTSVF